MLKVKIKWGALAIASAREAHTKHFESRRGVWYLEDRDVLCVYNNNPYLAGPEFREKETAKFRSWLKRQGMKELAYATYPADGEEGAGYTYAMILNASRDKIDDVCDELNRIMYETISVLSEQEYEEEG